MEDSTEQFSEEKKEASEFEVLKETLQKTQLKEKENFDQLLRLGAEFENYRKRTESRMIDARKAGREDVLLEIVSLVDALIQAETSFQNATDVGSLKKGLMMVNQLFEKFLRDQGLAPIKAKGEKFDPHRHEAMIQEVNNDLEEGTIIEEIQRGYMLKDRMVRPARVKVSTKSADTSAVNFKED